MDEEIKEKIVKLFDRIVQDYKTADGYYVSDYIGSQAEEARYLRLRDRKIRGWTKDLLNMLELKRE